jgi:hypothetical protein
LTLLSRFSFASSPVFYADAKLVSLSARVFIDQRMLVLQI